MISENLSFEELSEALLAVNSKILMEPDQGRILSDIAASAMQVFGADSCRIHRYDPVTQRFQERAGVGLGAQWKHEPRPDGMGRRVLESGRSAWEYDPGRLNPVVRRAGITCAGVFPLQPEGGRPVGVLYLHFRERPEFSPRDLNLVYHFAYHAGLAIRLTELRESDRRHIEDLQALHAAVYQVASAGTLRESLLRVARLAMQVVHADAAILYPWNQHERTLNRDLVVGEGLDMHRFRIAEPRPNGLTHTLMEQGVLCVEDVEVLPERQRWMVKNLHDHIMAANGLQSFIGLSLSAGGTSVGVLYVFFRVPHQPGGDEINTLRIFAESAATRIQLAQLSEARRKAATAEAIAALSAAAAQFAHKMANVAGTVPMIINDIKRKLEDNGVEDERIFRRLDDLREDTRGLMDMADELRVREISNPVPVDLSKLIDDAVRAAHLPPEVAVIVDRGHEPHRVRAVKVNLKEIVVNLLQNAEQAGARTIQIVTRPRPEEGMIDLHVLDDGSGIKPEDVEKVFMPLYTTKGKEEGPHGIGLWASRYQIERMDGEISMESTFGEGTKVTISLRIP